MPELTFQVQHAAVLPYAATPTLNFTLRIESEGSEPVRFITLKTQIRILTAQRPYSATEQRRLADLFGEPSRWGDTLKSLLWAHSTVLVPSFTGATEVELPIPCTYDFEVVSAKYFHGLEHGEIPLEFLFSGSVFYAGPAGLQVSQIPWEKEAHFRMPVALWQELMHLYFPNSAWLRLRQEVFERLDSYRMHAGLATADGAVERLLRASEEEAP